VNDPVRETLDAATRAGASACDAYLIDRDGLQVEVRAGEIDKLARAHDRVLSLRLFRGSRVAAVSTSDLSREGIRSFVDRARELADAAEADPCTGLPEETAKDDPSLEVFCPETAALTPDEAIERARATDRAACGYDPRIRPIGFAGLGAETCEVRLGRSDGFDRSYRFTSSTLFCVSIAEDGTEKQRDIAHQYAPSITKLPAPEEVGREAAARAVRRLGASKIPTGQVPVIYEPRTAITLVRHLGAALVGTSIDQARSFLAQKLDETVAGPGIGLTDDGRRPGVEGSRPFDGEGVPTRQTSIIKNGVLRSYLLDTYTARRLGLRTTGNAARRLRGAPEPSHSNLFLEPGSEDPAAILARTERGLLVTDLLGFGFNPVTGDYSRGIGGLWIEEGEVQRAVQEVTVAGNLLEMLREVDALGNDLTFFGSVGAPTLRFRDLTVAGA
jgi:PmbA protein